MEDRDRWLAAQIADLQGNPLGRIPAEPAIYAPPWVALEHEPTGDYLRFPEWPLRPWEAPDAAEPAEPWQPVSTTSTRNLLGEFVGLTGRPASRFLQFAERYGPLFLITRQDENAPITLRAWSPDHREEPREWCRREPLSLWRDKAQQYRSFLSVAAYLRQNAPAPPSAWWPPYQAILADDGVATASTKELGEDVRGVRFQKVLLAEALNQEARLVQPEPSLRVTHDLTLAVSSGFGFLPACWHQLVQAITGYHSVYICDGCGRLFIRGRKAQAGRHVYCPRCGPAVAKRNWQRNNPPGKTRTKNAEEA